MVGTTKPFDTFVTTLQSWVCELRTFTERDSRSSPHDGNATSESPPKQPRTTHSVESAKDAILDRLQRSDGGIKQQILANELDWSESTVSRRLSELESAGAINRYQIGRENLVFLAGQEPDSLTPANPGSESPSTQLPT